MKTTRIKVIFQDIKKLLPIFILAIVGLLIARGAEALIYKFVQPLFDLGIIAKQQQFLISAPWYLIGIFALRAIGDFTCKCSIGYAARSVIKIYRSKILQHVLAIPLQYFHTNDDAQIITKINYDVEQLARAMVDAVREAISSVVMISFLFGVMFSVSWRLTLVICTIVPIVGCYLRMVSNRMRKYGVKIQATIADITKVTTEILQAKTVIRAFAGYKVEQARIATVTESNKKQEMKIIIISALSETIMLLISAIVLALLVYLATKNTLGWNISPGEFVSLFGAVFALIRPIKHLTEINHILQRGIAAVDSIFTILELPLEEEYYSNAKNTNHVSAVSNELPTKAIVFEDVSFSYGNNIILDQVNFTINQGEIVALVGASGIGKTSLMHLLLRFYPINNGAIYVNHRDISTISLAQLRQKFAIVSQDIVLFNDTVANNVAYGCLRGCSEEQIIEALTMANAMEFVQRLPLGINTVIGSNGNLLSGGQRQRLAIARALLKNSPILLLDEATSALDMQAEKSVHQAITKLCQNRTVLIISHRESTLVAANRVLLLKQGKITTNVAIDMVQ